MTQATVHRRRRLWGWLAGGLLLGALLGGVVLYVASQTARGQQEVLEFTLERLGRGIQGELRVARVRGNLLTGAWLYDVSLRTRDGEPFLVADSAYLDYTLRTLLTARINIERAELYQPQVYIRRLPGDSLWNYQELFRDTSSVPRPEGPERHTFVHSAVVVNGRARVQLPWEPTPGLSARAQRAEVAEVLADTSQLLVQRVRGGFLRTANFTRLDGRFSRIRFAPGTEAGTYVRVDALSGIAQVYRDPLRIVALTGEVLSLDQQVQFHAPAVRLPHSRLGVAGRVYFPPDADEPYYDVFLVGEEIALRDMQWLYPRFPREGRGTLSLLVETRPDGTLFLARDARMQLPGTRVAGSFGMIVGDTLRFVDVDLTADPLRVATIEAMLPEQLPVVGLRIGAAEIQGPER